MTQKPPPIATRLKMLSKEIRKADSIQHSIPTSFDTTESFEEYVSSLAFPDSFDFSLEVFLDASVDLDRKLWLEFDLNLSNLLSSYKDQGLIQFAQSVVEKSAEGDLKDILKDSVIPRTIGPLVKAKVQSDKNTEYIYSDRTKGYVAAVIEGNGLHFDFLHTAEYYAEQLLGITNAQFLNHVYLPLKGVEVLPKSHAVFSISTDITLLSIELTLREKSH